MVIEALKKFVGRTETQSFSLKEVKLPPDLERKYALMYLIYKLGSLSRTDAEKIALEIYGATKKNEHPSFSEICTRSGLHRKELKNDPFLDHTSLVYTTEEMERQYRLEPINEEKLPRGRLVDVLTGSGPTRPLLKELYSLDSLNLISEQNSGDFQITDHGACFAETIGWLYKVRNWKLNFVLRMGKYGRES